ncbi:putative membrane protein [Methanomicrobium sp. W14]|jgi:uncharacterized membrane protein|uniref:TMEM175 family protein n=1 Tax=Methanomicrobium sp. W14 TaxID=2817839 RepID=UPI001AEA2419|nr:TMEM175 family protein [Methanomicrobium sp. W14]MBP2132447.1 putative membrane protein [Methanomicrobium sp. W14]
MFMPGQGVLGKNRIEALTDGVYAIALTLGVLTIDISEIPSPDTLDNGIYGSLSVVFPQVFYYAIAFFVLVSFWMAHHRMMDSIKYVDNIFNWMNMIVLFFVALVPFTTDFMGYYDDYALAVEVYALNLLIIGLIQTASWHYISSKKDYLKDNISCDSLLGFKLRGLVCPAASLVVIAYAWLFSPQYATLLFLLIPVFDVFVSRHIKSVCFENNA